MPEKKDPRITVVASAALLAQLLNADTALKASRMKPERKVADAIHALIVQLTSVRSKVPVVTGQFLQPTPPTDTVDPGSELFFVAGDTGATAPKPDHE